MKLKKAKTRARLLDKQLCSISRVVKKLQSSFYAEGTKSPHTVSVNIWDDGDFDVRLRSGVYIDGPQHEQVRKDPHRVLVIDYHYHRGKITREQELKTMTRKIIEK